MTHDAGVGTSTLTVALDVRHPLACLALHPALAFGASMRVDVDWLPLEVPPLKPPGTASADDDRGVRHRRLRAQAIAREIDTYAAVQGLVMREPYRDGSAEAARRGWLFMRDRHPDRLGAHLVELFRGYWALELDVSDPSQVADLIDRTGGDGAAFAGWHATDGARASREVADALAARGIFQVPAFVLGDEVFYGRQHLPMLRWILEGRVGRGPI